MHPSTLFSLFSFGLLSVSVVQGSNFKKIHRVNRLSTSLNTLSDDTEVNTAPVTTGAVEVLPEAVLTSQESNQVGGKSLEERRLEVFYSLFGLYERVVGRFSTFGVIEWFRVSVLNWPEQISKSDMSLWTEDDVAFLSVLIESDSIIFVNSATKPKKAPAPLRLPTAVKVETGAQLTGIEALSTESAAEAAEDVKPPSIGRPAKKIAAKKILKISVAKDDEEGDFEISSSDDSASDSKKVATPSLKSSNPSTPKTPIRTPRMIETRVFDDTPADPERKAQVLAKGLQMFRRTSGNSTAEEIDWSLLRLNYLEYHAIPFSTNFETEGDLATFENLMRHKDFLFFNLTRTDHRKIRVAERLYALYLNCCGKYAHPFFIQWNSVVAEGWPQDINRSMLSFNKSQVERMEALLDADQIKFSLTEKFAQEIAAVEAGDFGPTPKTKRSRSATDETPREESKMPRKTPIEIEIPSSSVFLASASISPFRNGVSSNSGFFGLPSETLELIRKDATESIKECETTLEMVSDKPRFIRIIKQVLKCLRLIKLHADSVTEKVETISLDNILQFIEIFYKFLLSIKTNGDLNENELKHFVINAIKFNALLAGAKYKRSFPGDRNPTFKILKSSIRDIEKYAVLTKPESEWASELELLETSLDLEGNQSIFISQ